jgi:Trk-type K+ transport system membrane component
MHLVQQFLGSVTLWLLAAAVVSGAVLFKFPLYRKHVPVKFQLQRKTIAKAHLYVFFVIIVTAFFHYFLSEESKRNTLLYALPISVALGALLGLSLRQKKFKGKYFKKIITVKIIILTLLMLSGALGHALIKNNEEHSQIVTEIIIY